MFDAEKFSRDLKIQKLNYKEQLPIDHKLIASHVAAMPNINLNDLKSDDDKKAFWINIYNGMTNFLIIDRKVKKEMKEDPNIFSQPTLTIGKFQFSLDDIEHGLLRLNARKSFSDNDPRLAFMVDQLDYRIHFALNCGAHSCPPIAFYSSQYIDQQLQMAEEVFAEAEFLVSQQNKTIKCSQLFIWYREDFHNVYLNNPIYKAFRVQETPYDWSI